MSFARLPVFRWDADQGGEGTGSDDRSHAR